MSLIDMVQQQLGQHEIEQISQQIGADTTQTRTAIEGAVPMLLGGLAGAAQQPEGAAALQQAVAAHGEALGGLGGLGGMLAGGGGAGGGLGGILSGALGGMLGGGGGGGGGMGGLGGGILGSILGQHHGAVEDGVQQHSGLNSDQTRKLLMILAPIVLGMLAKRHANAGPDQINASIQEDARKAHEHAQKQSPQMGGILGKILNSVVTPRR